MGGLPPLGYDAIDRQLQVNAQEAETVRHIFRRYGEIGKVDALRRELAGQGVVGKLLQRQDGRLVGGKPLQRGALYRMLQNPLYRGQIRHREQIYEGQHPAIIDDDLWQAVQARLEANRIADANKSNAHSPSLLTGKIITDQGHPFTPSHANKAGKRYRYYVSRPGDTNADGETPHRRWRIPANALEHLVLDNIRRFLGDARQPRAILTAAGVPELDQLQALDRAETIARQRSEATDPDGRLQVRALIERITIAEDGITIALAISALLGMLGLECNSTDSNQIHELSVPARLQRAGMEMRLVDERATGPGPDATLVRLLTKAWAIRNDMLRGDGRSLTEIAAAHSIGDSYAGRLLRIAFLAPEIVEAILAGKQPVDLTANRLATIPEIPVDWAEQRMLILGTDVQA